MKILIQRGSDYSWATREYVPCQVRRYMMISPVLVRWYESNTVPPTEEVYREFCQQWPFDSRWRPHRMDMSYLRLVTVEGPFIVVVDQISEYQFDEAVIERDKADWIHPNDVRGYQTPR